MDVHAFHNAIDHIHVGETLHVGDPNLVFTLSLAASD